MVLEVFLSAVVLLLVLGIWLGKKLGLLGNEGKKPARADEEAQGDGDTEAVITGSRRRGGGAARNRRGRRARGGADDDEDMGGPSGTGAPEVDEEMLEELRAAETLTKAQRKQLAKAEKKAAKKQSREAQQHAVSAKEERRAKRASKYEERDREIEEERRRLAEEEERKRKEKEEAEHAEYLKWKDMMSVEQEGSQEAQLQEENQGLLGEFIDHIKEAKVVSLEDLGKRFGLRPQDVVNRVKALEAMGAITGLVDDRGKFIYVTMDEMQAIAKYIMRMGRVSIPQLAEQSNKLIKLEGNERKEQTDK